jgi:hypothetical protein
LQKGGSMFNDDFFSTLPKDPASAAFSLIVQFTKFNNECNKNGTTLDNYGKYVQAAGLCQGFIRLLDVSVPKLTITTQHKQDIANIVAFFNNASKAFAEKNIDYLSIQAYERLQNQFESSLIYKFTEWRS